MWTVRILLLTLAVVFIMAVATEVFVDDFVRPRSLFAYLLVSSLITCIAATFIDVGEPRAK